MQQKPVTEREAWVIEDGTGDVLVQEGKFDTIDACEEYIDAEKKNESRGDGGLVSTSEPTLVPPAWYAAEGIVDHARDMVHGHAPGATVERWVAAVNAAEEAGKARSADPERSEIHPDK